MNIYAGGFLNLEPSGQKEYTLMIYDRETVQSGNDFNLLFWVRPRNDGTQDVVFTWNSLRNINATNGVYVGYYDGATFHDTSVSRVEQTKTINIPEGNYTYYLYIDYAVGLDVRYQPISGSMIELEMAETPVVVEVVDNDEDAFTPVRSKRLNIKVHSSQTVGAEDFVDGGDTRFYVELLHEDEGVLFCGFLSTEDVHVLFQPDPNIIELTATDGLGFLSDEPLTTLDGTTPEYEHDIMSFISWALAKSGLLLSCDVVMNVREEDAVTLLSDLSEAAGHFYKYCYLNSKTFEAAIGECEDSRTVLEKILGESCEMFQHRGKWFIRRVDEVEHNLPYYQFTFDHKGDFESYDGLVPQKNIGVGLPLAWMNDDTDLGFQRMHRQIIETYKFNTWEELVCNQDFSRGDFFADLPDVTLDDGTIQQAKKYDVDCWFGQKFPANAPGDPNGGQIIPADNDAYIERRFEYGYEKERYLVLTAGPAYDFEGVSSQPINVVKGDKLNFSIPWRLPSNVGSGTGALSINIFSVWIVTPSGDWYYLNQNYDTGGVVPNGKFVWNGPYDGQRTQAVQYNFVPGQTDERDWVTISADAPACPVAGKLSIGLWKVWQGSSLWNVDTYFGRLQIDFFAFVNGSYDRFNGQQHIVSPSGSSPKAVRDEEVFISDSPSLNYKGALLRIGSYQIFYTGNITFAPDGTDNTSLATLQTSSFLGLYKGQKIKITSGLNTGIYTVSNVRAGVLVGPVVYINFEETLNYGATTGDVEIPNFELAGRFYAANVFPGGPPDDTYYHPFGEIQSFDVANQFNRTMRIFEGTVDGTEELPDMFDRFVLTDQDVNAYVSAEQYRVFRLLHYEMNLHLCEWAAYFRETVKTDIAKQYTGHEFKYLTESE